MLLQASRNGYFFVLDRTNGKNLLTTPFAAVNWAKGIDEEGRPIPDPAKEPSRDGVLIAPNEGGAHQLSLAELRPEDRPVDRQRAGRLRHLLLQAGARRLRLGGRRLQRLRPSACCARSTTRPARSAGATTSATARRGAGVLTTESGLTFTGDTAGNALALRTSDGTTLWHAGIGRVGNAPITYELDGRQYVLIGGGSALYAWTLP